MIIAISGRKGSGKDTLGKYLINRGFIRYAFADALKDINQILFDLSEEQLNGDLKETIDQRYNKTPRELNQFIGTLLRNNMNDLIDNYGPNVWSNVIKHKIQNTKNIPIVITDLRFKNEYEMLKSFGAIIINVERPDLTINKFNNHESEQIELDYDYKLINNSTIENLYKDAEKILEKYKNSYFL